MGAVTTDIRAGRISNRLVCLGITTGLLFQIWESGAKGLILFILQIIIPVILFYLLFLMRALGAGDIKLFSMIGSIWNIKVLGYCIIFSFLTGAVISLTKLLYQKNLTARLCCFCRYIRISFETRHIGIYDRGSEGKQNVINFSVAILVGYCITMGVVM